MHVCLFDIDGTLLASGGAGKAAMEEALGREFALPRVLDGVPYAGRTDRAIARDLFELHGLEDSLANRQRFQRAYLKILPQALARHTGRVLPGIGALLESLGQRHDVALGLLTGNLRAGAELKLSHYGLFKHFSFGAFGDDFLDRDDVARAAAAALPQHLGGRIVKQVWVVGDTPLDVRCARCIGARAVAVATGWHSHAELEAAGPDLLFTDLADHAPMLAHLI